MSANPADPAALGQVDLLYFDIGERRYAADAAQVLRVDRALAEDHALETLGALRQGARALIFDTDDGERHLRVDAVVGVRTVPIEALRRLPVAAAAPDYAIGVCLADEAQPVLLLDLVATEKAQGRP